MSSTPKQSSDVSQLKRALAALKEMRAKLDAVEQARTEPIAVIGMACRFPGGANTLEAFWELLRNGGDGISEVPADRWDVDALYDPDPTAPGKMSTRWGGFLDQVDQFDPHFFGISPREAMRMDPQQRLLLEVAWEALEHAGQTMEGLAGSSTGVFVGIHSHSADYTWLQFAAPTDMDVYTGTGTAHNVVAGRLSYVLDLQGPSIAMDTACSSSLVAVHQACQSLRVGDCRAALAAGVNLILSPLFTIAATRMQMLAPDGHCKTFDAQADGFVRSEGCGAVVLKRLSDALADGDRILALIRGSAVNQDGRTNGLTAPNGLSQQAVIRQALENAGVDPAQITYVETHGTGTPLGDPIEVEALTAAFGQSGAGRPPCMLGSAKANIGHPEGAAGIAGLIKTVLSLQHQAIPPLALFKQLNPHIALENTPFVIPTELTPWPASAGGRLAGVSSFGWSGTNVHVVLEEAPQPFPGAQSAETAEASQPYLLPLSAHSAEALKALAQSYQPFLSAADAELRDVCFTASVRRSHHEHRLAVAGHTRRELVEKLAAFADGQTLPGLSSGRQSLGSRPGLVFVFPGQGGQWTGMGRELLAQSPVFREALERCEKAMRPYVDWSLLEQIAADEPHSRLSEIDVVQPVLFAIQVALAALWRSWGIEPDAVVGHSLGEVAAAHVAGALSLEDAARIICRRSSLLRRVSGQGAMAVVGLSLAQADEILDGYREHLSIAVSNSPRSTVLSGDPAALAEVLDKLAAQNVFCRPIQVDVASHSPQMDPLRADLLRALEGLQPRAASVPIYSTVTGEAGDGATFDATYWVRNLRQPVLFATMVQRLIEADHTIFIEVSPHPILLPAIEETLHHLGRTGHTVPSLRRGQAEQVMMLEALGRLYTLGCPTDWRRLYPSGGRNISLPIYPWQRERLWLDNSTQAGFTPAWSWSGASEQHPLLGRRLNLASPGNYVWEVELSQRRLPYLYDHRIQGAAILAASAYLEIALAAAAVAFEGRPYMLADIDFQRPLFLSESGSQALQVALSPARDGFGFDFRIYSRSEEAWIQHLEGKIAPDNMSQAAEPLILEPIRSRCSGEIPGRDFYNRLEAIGVRIGASLQNVAQVRHGEGEALARVEIAELSKPGSQAYYLHPVASDPCFQISVVATPAFSTGGELGIPFHLDQVRLYGRPQPQMWSYLQVKPHTDTLVVDIGLFDETGQPVVEISGLHLKQVGHDAQAATQDLDGWLYELQWQLAPRLKSDRPASPAQGSWLIFGDGLGVGETLAKQIEAQGERCVLILAGDTYGRTDQDHFRIRPEHLEDMQRLFSAALGPDRPPCHGIVHLWSLDAPAVPELSTTSLEAAQIQNCGSALHLVQILAQSEWPERPRLWFATQGAQPVLEAQLRTTAVAQSPLWGLGRVIAEEHPELWGGLVDVDPTASVTEIATFLCEEIFNSDGEDQLAFYQQQRYAPRLVRARHAGGLMPATRWRSDSSYLITGGLGAIGLQVARWAVEQGARRLILMGRTPMPSRADWDQVEAGSRQARNIEAIRELERLGASVHVASVDVADETQLRTFLESFKREGWPPIRGVVHAAGVVEDRLLLKLDVAALQKVLRPKAIGGWNLHRLLGDIDYFVLFSSLGSLLGQPGQGNYAAANASLDALAHYRRGQGQTGLTINWGAWAGLGFAATSGGQRTLRSLAAQGIDSFTPAQGLAVLGRLLGQGLSQVAVMPVDWSKFSAARAKAVETGFKRGNRLLAQLAAEAGSPRPGSPGGVSKEESSIRKHLLAAEPEHRRALLETHLTQQIAQVLKLAPSRIEPDKPLGAWGVDSLMALELRNRLEADLDLTLSATLIWNYPTVADLANYLAGKMEICLETAAEQTDAGLSAETSGGSVEEDSSRLSDIVASIAALSDGEALSALLKRK